MMTKSSHSPPMPKDKAWNYAIGIVQVEGIKPSDDFFELVEKEKNGLMTSDDIQRVLMKKYTVIEGADEQFIDVENA